MQSCKNLGNEPFAYLRDVLGRVSTHPNGRIDDLLPDRRVLPKADPPPTEKDSNGHPLAEVRRDGATRGC